MRHALLVTGLLVFLLGGCFDFGSDDRPRTTPRPPAEACGSSQEREVVEQAPGLAMHAAANEYDEATGNRTVRWDLIVTNACQESSASAAIEARRSPLPQDCPPVDLRASVSTGLREDRIDLAGEEALTGAATFDPGRPDLQAGNATFVVSLSATFASRGSAPQDDQCLDGSVQGFTMRAAYRMHPA